MNQAEARRLPKDDPRMADRQAARERYNSRWVGLKHRNTKQLPPPEDLERVQVRLINAARKGKDEFNRVWEEIFHGKFPSPGLKGYRPNKDARK